MRKQIVPAILVEDVETLNKQLSQLEGVAEWTQIDFLDGKFVENKNLSISEIKEIKTNIKLEAHLMVCDPIKYLEALKNLDFKRFIFHFETVQDIEKTIKKAREYNFEVGIAINPDTTLEKLKPYIDKIDLVLVMSIFPGAQGLKFMPETINKIKNLRKLSNEIIIEVDGGLKLHNVKEVAEAGADLLDVGSAILENNKPKENFEKLQQEIM